MPRIPSVSIYIRITDKKGRRHYERVKRINPSSADRMPLCGDARSVLTRVSEHNLFVNNPPLSIYLHAGGVNAVYYDLVANVEGKLSYIEVHVETAIPGKALVLAWRPLNALLDAFVRNAELPLALSRLELVSPEDGEVIAYELVLPYRDGVRIGPLRGIDQVVPFAPYDAIYREAVVSSSRFTDCSAHFVSTTEQPKLGDGFENSASNIESRSECHRTRKSRQKNSVGLALLPKL